MSKALRRTILIVFILAAIITAGTITIKLTLTTDNIKSFIIEQVAQTTGRTLSIDGNVSWKLFPQIRLELNQLSLNNPQQPKEKISAKQIVVGVKLMPLLKKEINPTELSVDQFEFQDAEGNQFQIKNIDLSGSELKFDQTFPIDVNLQGISSALLSGDMKLTADGFLSQDLNTIKLNNYQLKLNDSTATGSFQLNGLNEKDADLTKSLIVNGDINVDKVKLSNFKLTDMSSKVNMKNAIITLSAIKAKSYSGTLSGKVIANIQESKPKYTVAMNANAINMKNLLQDITGKAYISGTGSLKLNLTTQGIEPDDLTKNLNGNTTSTIVNGKLLNLGFNQTIEQAAKALGQSIEVSDDFNKVQAKATIVNGVAKTTLTLDANNLTGTGDGTINLKRNKINMDIEARYLKSNETKDLVLPLEVSGQLDDIKISIDTSKLLSQTLAQHADKITDKAKEYGIDLSGLFGS